MAALGLLEILDFKRTPTVGRLIFCTARILPAFIDEGSSYSEDAFADVQRRIPTDPTIAPA
jgi:hypothetical protein